MFSIHNDNPLVAKHFFSFFFVKVFFKIVFYYFKYNVNIFQVVQNVYDRLMEGGKEYGVMHAGFVMEKILITRCFCLAVVCILQPVIVPY